MSSVSVLDVADATFEAEVVERSHQLPVVVDFWAAWCGPCRALSPVLERLAHESGGQWVLAKVDVDANPTLAARFGIQGIPAVRAWREGREIAEFVGALPEPQVREWLGQLGPSPADLATDEGDDARSRGELENARAAYARALQHDPGHDRARSGLEALELELRAATVNEQAARRALDSDPSDVAAAIQLADLSAARDDYGEASELLLNVVRNGDSVSREEARKHLLKLLDTLPPDDERALAARRSLSLALF